MLEAGLSPNACNEHGESLLHMVCRHGKVDLFRILLAFDVDLQQTDDYGRTPVSNLMNGNVTLSASHNVLTHPLLLLFQMHDCAWAANPSFEIAKCLLQCDPNFLYLFDARGSLPLSYVTKPLWGEWNTFLANSLDVHFPKENPRRDEVPILCGMKPDSRPVPDPKNKIPAQLAKAVAMGEMSPYEAIINQGTDDDDTYLCSEIDSDDSSYYSDEDSDFDSDEEEELCEIVGQIGNLNLNTIQEH